MAETTNANETYQPMTFDAIKIGLASPEKIREWSRGEVLKPEKEYVEQIRSVTDALYEKNWKIYSLKNYWVNDSFPYNGVNAKFKNSRNYRIEIQFHTQ